jgi:hypothetical protein
LNLDLEELNFPNKNLNVNLDALGSKLDLFFHKTCLMTEFICYLRKIISLLYELFFLLKFGRLIGLWVRNKKKLSLHQMEFSNSRYSSWNDQRSTLTECKICLWRLRFPWSFSFYFSFHICIKGIDVSFLMPLESLCFYL